MHLSARQFDTLNQQRAFERANRIAVMLLNGTKLCPHGMVDDVSRRRRRTTAPERAGASDPQQCRFPGGHGAVSCAPAGSSVALVSGTATRVEPNRLLPSSTPAQRSVQAKASVHSRFLFEFRDGISPILHCHSLGMGFRPVFEAVPATLNE